jgi:hypothetical protein
MLELGLRRALVISSLALTTTFAAGAARADEPPPAAATLAPLAPPPQAKAPPVYSPPPGFDLGYSAAPPGYGAPDQGAIPFERQPVYPPEMRSRSTGMIAGGVILMSFGLIGLAAGSAFVGAHEPTQTSVNSCFDCNFDSGGGGVNTGPTVVLKPGFKAAGIATLVGSVAAIGVSIPLLVIGSKKVPYVDDASPAARAAKWTPSLHVGAGAAALTWQF